MVVEGEALEEVGVFECDVMLDAGSVVEGDALEEVEVFEYDVSEIIPTAPTIMIKTAIMAMTLVPIAVLLVPMWYRLLECRFVNTFVPTGLFEDHFRFRKGWNASAAVGQPFTSPDNWTEPRPTTGSANLSSPLTGNCGCQPSF